MVTLCLVPCTEKIIPLTGVQIMFNIEKAHMILDEMIMNGHITETNKNRALAPIVVLDKAIKQLNL